MSESDVHSYNTRYASNLNYYKLRVRTNIGIHTFKFAVSKIYEEIPASLKTFRFNQFKFHCKLFFLSKQIKS